jgi:hypothetical protein
VDADERKGDSFWEDEERRQEGGREKHGEQRYADGVREVDCGGGGAVQHRQNDWGIFFRVLFGSETRKVISHGLGRCEYFSPRALTRESGTSAPKYFMSPPTTRCQHASDRCINKPGIGNINISDGQNNGSVASIRWNYQ